MPEDRGSSPITGAWAPAYRPRMELALQETFLMERYWPGVSRADLVTTEEHLCRAAGELTRDGIPIRILSSTWIPADEVVLTLFEAGEEDDVLEVGRRSNYPFDRMQRRPSQVATHPAMEDQRAAHVKLRTTSPIFNCHGPSPCRGWPGGHSLSLLRQRK